MTKGVDRARQRREKQRSTIQGENLKGAVTQRDGANSHFDLEKYLAERRATVEAALARHLDSCVGAPATQRDAMAWSLLAGGKRLRPILALAACEAVGGAVDDAIDAACAVEFIHTYSLIHDDLPAMDDDDFRRGRPTSHKKFGEAVAILAGDAMCAEAFRVAAAHRKGREAAVADVVFELARASGAVGMVGGQVIDIEATGKRVTVKELEVLHHAKTGELLLVAVRAGARMGAATEAQLERLTIFGRALGLAFQIVDDVLDITADLATLGKDPGSDRDAGKTTFVDLLGVDGARARARQVMSEGIDALAPLGTNAEALRALGRYTVERDR
jgi:geranylgeranyl diphosphate synthase type II